MDKPEEEKRKMMEDKNAFHCSSVYSSHYYSHQTVF
jgi:hypothetical protein